MGLTPAIDWWKYVAVFKEDTSATWLYRWNLKNNIFDLLYLRYSVILIFMTDKKYRTICPMFNDSFFYFVQSNFLGINSKLSQPGCLELYRVYKCPFDVGR